jgi:dCMP deaminase
MTTPTNKDYIRMADIFAQASPDTSRKTGCVIQRGDRTLMHGVNTFPRGVKPRLSKPEKYAFTEHAERNAIYEAAQFGVALDGSTIYVNWFPCADCARAIVQSGIKKLVGYEPDWTETRYGFKDARTILEEGGVEIVFEERD